MTETPPGGTETARLSRSYDEATQTSALLGTNSHGDMRRGQDQHQYIAPQEENDYLSHMDITGNFQNAMYTAPTADHQQTGHLASNTIRLHYPVSGNLFTRTLDYKEYELKDHASTPLSTGLSNVRVVVGDGRNTAWANGLPVASADIKTAMDYYPFGAIMPGKSFYAGDKYRFDFQGQEKDQETGLNAFHLRSYQSWLGRWLSPDPMGQHWSPYLAMSNNPVTFRDPTGGWDEGDPPPYGDTYNWDGKTFTWDEEHGQYRREEYNRVESLYFVEKNRAEVNHMYYTSDNGPSMDVLPNPPSMGSGPITELTELVPPEEKRARMEANQMEVMEAMDGGCCDWMAMAGWIPVIGPALESGQKLQNGDYAGASVDFGYALADVFLLGFASRARMAANGAKWAYGSFKSSTKWANQLAKRGWTEKQITEAITKGKSFSAVNNVNKANTATRYVHPQTGQSVVIDDVTKELLHVGGPGFKY